MYNFLVNEAQIVAVDDLDSHGKYTVNEGFGTEVLLHDCRMATT